MRLLTLITALVVVSVASPQQPASVASPRTRTLFDDGWQFKAGDVPGAEAPDFDSSSWEAVDLPHDFMIEGKGQRLIVPGGRQGGRGNANLPENPEGPFDPRSPGGSGNGYLNGGVGWYRKQFQNDLGSPSTRRMFLQFEGAYMNTEVWLNGVKVGGRPYGYSTFEIDLTPALRVGHNWLAVRVYVPQPSSRWYSGAGIYRHVWKTITEEVHLARWGTVITTPEVSELRASVRVKTAVTNETPRPASAVVETVLLDHTGREMARSRGGLEIPANGSAAASADLTLPKPRRWSVSDPYLYTIESRVRIGDRLIDVERAPFGVRTIEFNTDGTFAINGVPMKLYGVCLHHDLGPLGAAAFDRGIERQLEIMKRMGVNAIRTSHNPPAPALLDLADRMGFVVMDEAFDEWKQNKTRFGYGQFFDEWSERDIRDMVRRDRNHPSVVMWSIGNEIPEQRNQEAGASMAARLAAFVRDEDPTRPVTAAMNNPTQALATGFAKAVDLFGVNYNLGVYDSVAGNKAYASETSSNYSSRDQYNLVLKDGAPAIVNQLDNHTTSYDLDFPRWGNTAERQFQALADAPWMAGEFVWTGIDYIGEPTPFNWPNRSSSFGIVDIAGFPKDRFFLYQSKWTTQPVLHILPHWNWPDEYKGKNIPVWAYTNADSVELFLNGRSQGRRDWTGVTATHLSWEVPYAPGTLRAVARKGGRVVGEQIVETTGAAARLELVADRAAIRGDGQDLSFVTVRVVDAQGRLCRTCGNQSIAFTLSGGGSIAGIDNGDPTNHEAFVGPTKTAATHRAFNGLAIVVIRAPRGAAAMTLSAAAAGLRGATIAIRAQ